MNPSESAIAEAARAHEEGLPDRPIPPWLRAPRTLVRKLRLLKLRITSFGKVKFGDDVNIGASAVMVPPNMAKFGNHVIVGRDFLLMTDLEIGDETVISSRVMIAGDDHKLEDSNLSVYFQGRKPAGKVVLEGDNFIGLGVKIVGNVTIGKGCIVGAGAVVIDDLPPGTVCAGVPARVLRDRVVPSA